MAAIVTFDPVNLRIVEINTGSPAVNTLSAAEIYSEWKDWLLSDFQNMGYPPAFSQIAEEFSPTEDIGPYFFLINGWKIRPAEYAHKLIVDGNLISQPTTESIFVPTLGAFNAHTETKVSAIFSTKTVSGGGGGSDPTLLYLGAVWIDANNGTAGTTVGVNGLPTSPVTTLADALTLAAATGLRSFVVVEGNLTLTSALTEWHVELRSPDSELNFNGQNVNGSAFTGAGKLKGTMTGRIETHHNLLEDVTGFLGTADFCGISGTIALGVGKSSFVRCYSDTPGTGTPALNFVGAGRSCNFRAYSGGMQFENMVDASNVCTAEYIAGQAVIDGSCTAGTLVLRGIIDPVTDNGAGVTVLTSAVVSRATVSADVWEVLTSTSFGAGSVGEFLAELQARGEVG